MKLLRAIWRRLRPSKGQWVRIQPTSTTSGTAAGAVVMEIYQWTPKALYEWRPR